MKFKILSILTGRLLFIFSSFLLFFSGIAFFVYPEEQEFIYFFISSICTFCTSGLLIFFSKGAPIHEISFREGFAIATIGWLVLSCFGALPFYFSNQIPYFIDAYFETISGLTTTGASILPDIESLLHTSLLWRSFMHAIGGMGIIVLSLAVLPNISSSTLFLFKAETSGAGTSSLPYGASEIAKRLYLIYILMNICMCTSLVLLEMDLFEALCHTFGTLGTGGFSPLQHSLGQYALENHPYAIYYEIIVTFFMFLAGVNFSLYLHFFIKGTLNIWNDIEFKVYLLFIAFCILITSLDLYLSQQYGTIQEIFRHTTFTSLSIITSTGYATEDYNLWPTTSKMLLYCFMFIGGMSGSTSGGMKVVRMLFLWKTSMLVSIKSIYPNRITSVKISNRILPKETYDNMQTFILLFFCIYGVGIIILSFTGLDFETVLSMTVATLGTTGPGLGAVGPAVNYSHLPVFAKLTTIALMLFGRLEIIPLLVLFNINTWKKS